MNIEFTLYVKQFGDDIFLVRSPWERLHYVCTEVGASRFNGDKECIYTYRALMALPIIWRAK